MGNRKGQKHYLEHIKQIIVAEQRKGKSDILTSKQKAPLSRSKNYAIAQAKV